MCGTVAAAAAAAAAESYIVPDLVQVVAIEALLAEPAGAAE